MMKVQVYVKKLPIIWFELKWLFCNENTYILILNNQYYIWWLCKKWKKLNPKSFGNIILIRKRRTIIFLWKAYKLLLWMVYNTMPEKMFSYLNIHRMKWFDLHESLLNSHISYLYWAVKLTPSTLSVSRFYFEAEGALVEFREELLLVLKA